MKRYVVEYSGGAQHDLADLAALIAEQTSAETAMRFTRSLTNECGSLSLAPYRGSKRDELRPNMRIIGFRHAVSIVFRVEEKQRAVVVLGISYRGRSIDRILDRNE